MGLGLYALDDFYFCLRVIVQAGNVVLEKEKMPLLVPSDICIQLDAEFLNGEESLSIYIKDGWEGRK